jgi:hypothetical protein
MSSLGVVDIEGLPDGALHRAQSEIIEALERQVRAQLQERREVLLSMAAVLVEEESLPGDMMRELLAEPDAARRLGGQQQAPVAADGALARPEAEGHRARAVAATGARRRNELPAETGTNVPSGLPDGDDGLTGRVG